MTGLLLDTPLSAMQREYAETVRASAESLLTVINDIIDFSKIEAGKLHVEAIDMDLRSCVEDLGAAMAFQAASKDLELVVSIAPEVPECIVGDPQRIRQCLTNLVSNALKLTTTGEVVIEVMLNHRAVDVPLLRFAVRDSGDVPVVQQPGVHLLM